MMVILGTGFQESLTHPDGRMSICSLTLPDHGGYTNSSWLESDLKMRKCQPKLDVILTIRFKISAEIKIREYMFCVLSRRRVVLALYGIWYVLSLPWNTFTLFFYCQYPGLYNNTAS